MPGLDFPEPESPVITVSLISGDGYADVFSGCENNGGGPPLPPFYWIKIFFPEVFPERRRDATVV